MTSPAIIKDPDPRARPSWGFDWRENIVYIGFVFVLVVFGFTLFDQGFLNPNNLLNILRQTSIIAVMAVGMTFVISAAEIDLSVGAVAGLASVTTAYTVAQWGLFRVFSDDGVGRPGASVRR